MQEKNLEKIVSWAKRRGFVMPGSEIYGGISGIYDFGPYGVALKNNIKKIWWKTFVEDSDDIVGIESAILMNRKVWQASGHEKGFVDELVECKKCHQRYKADDLPETKCQSGGEHEFTEAKQFNPMFKTHVGVIESDESMTYLRPETAQGMFTNFKQVMETSRKKLPFGIAQIGKSFRNEINTKDFLFRVREFEIAEIEYFVKPGDDEKAFDEWLKSWEEFVLSLGIKKENIKHYEHPKEGLSHYSKRTVDIQYNYPFGYKELTGLANRTDFDLKAHQEASGKDLTYFDEETKEKVLPYVIEPTLGIERLMLAVICDAFEEIQGGRGVDKSDPSTNAQDGIDMSEIVLHLSQSIAPVKIAVLPLVKKLSEKGREIYKDLKTCWGEIEFDESGSIGRRYRRQDEIGTPYCVTIDFEEDRKVTVRNRDTMKQERVDIKELKNHLFEKLGNF
ncbi:MAG: glycyl-tRNA synthetase, glycyl-tRNA synthetase [Candidatus Berkelbacteria bacterium]|nr:glycyl-tRNA synthetase, glycyl-tRNA synthetase [Candidatus Berkelbacteria bacterium]